MEKSCSTDRVATSSSQIGYHCGSASNAPPSPSRTASGAPARRAIPRLELVATCDLRRELVEQMQQRWDIPAGYTDWRKMLDRERPDIVAIVTAYGSTHAALAAGVAETGLVRGIYCEKPIAT